MKLNREFLLLAESLELNQTNKYNLGNWYESEKLDGMRAIWLPDTRGIRVGDLPFANLEKDATGSRDRMASGLWSRYANPIWAPVEFLDQLPKDIAVDGELWSGRKQFQRIMSIAKTKYPGPEWANIKYCVFDSPSFHQVYRDGKIHNGQLKKRFLGIYEWAKKTLAFDYANHERTFDYTYHYLRSRTWTNQVVLHEQRALPWRHADAVVELNKRFQEVLSSGGEGLIIRAPHSTWEPLRSKLVLKVKDTKDAEGIVIGINPGEGRLDGMIGSLQIRTELNGKIIEFGLSGLTDVERSLPSSIFHVGTLVTYSYRELSQDGVPKEARFLRIYE